MFEGGGGTSVTDLVSVLVVLAAGLLVPAGIAKLREPRVARQALGLPARATALVRLIGVGELALAALVLLIGGPILAGVLAATYLAFAVVATRQRAKGASCGCFGASRGPTTLGHVAMNLVAATAAGVGVAVGTVALPDLVAGAPLAGVPLVAAGIVAVATAQLSITTLPEVLAAARRTGSSTGGDA